MGVGAQRLRVEERVVVIMNVAGEWIKLPLFLRRRRGEGKGALPLAEPGVGNVGTKTEVSVEISGL